MTFNSDQNKCKPKNKIKILVELLKKRKLKKKRVSTHGSSGNISCNVSDTDAYNMYKNQGFIHQCHRVISLLEYSNASVIST